MFYFNFIRFVEEKITKKLFWKCRETCISSAKWCESICLRSEGLVFTKLHCNSDTGELTGRKRRYTLMSTDDVGSTNMLLSIFTIYTAFFFFVKFPEDLITNCIKPCDSVLILLSYGKKSHAASPNPQPNNVICLTPFNYLCHSKS